MSGVYAVKVVGTVSGIIEKFRKPWSSGTGWDRRGEAASLIAEGYEMITSNVDHCCLLQLPDDVKQSIEDAGARYIPYVLRLFKITGQAC